MAELKELSPEQKLRPYSKYYYYEFAAPARNHVTHLADPKPIDPAKALRIEDLDDLFAPGYLKEETGYCALPDGSGYVATLHKMPEATGDMIDWWWAWHALEDLRYKIWFPECHFAISVKDEDRSKVLDPHRSVRERYRGITHHSVEDIVCGGVAQDVYITFMSPEDFGFDTSRLRSADVATIVCATALAKPVDAPAGAPSTPVAFIHFVRNISRGIEVRNRFWIGHQIVDKKPKLSLPPGFGVPQAEAAAEGLFIHSLKEFCNLGSILPQIYREQSNKVE